ncbi:alpha/beta fold hydrolase [Paenibacillus albus]|uniref:alpha/beta fold hydrolase n=1 Tax=Paenibacillus albus TaxID=2495582 RepID=UPI001D130DDE|nr:alpha/beta hydrolase [Paenibacillus albus]
MDQRGCLRSDAIEEAEDFSVQHLIDDFEALRAYFGVERWGLIGHSFGGYLAIEYAYQHPNAIDQMVLECPSFDLIESFRSVVSKAEQLYLAAGDRQLADRCRGAYTCSVNELFRTFSAISEKRDQVYFRSLSPSFFDVLVEQSGIDDRDWQKQMMFQNKLNDSVFNQPNLDKLSSINCPVLLIKGRYDPICSEYQTEQFLKNVRNSSVVTFDHSAHMPRHEEPDLFAETIEAFVTLHSQVR